MSVKEFFVLVMICTIWGLHFPIISLTVNGIAPPLFYAATRMLFVMLILLPKLKWHKGLMVNILVAGLGFGALNYAFMFPAMSLTTASAGAITIELFVPFSIILSFIFLKERFGSLRLLGVVLAFIGVAVLALSKPPEESGQYFLLGIGLIMCAAMAEAVGAIMVKTVKSVGPLELLVWFALVGNIVLWPLTLILEDNQMQAFGPDTRMPFIYALIYSVIFVSIFAHGSYYWLLQRLPMYVVAGSGLMTTVVAVTASIVLVSDPVSWQLFVGGVMTLTGVTLILLRNAQKKQNTVGHNNTIK